MLNPAPRSRLATRGIPAEEIAPADDIAAAEEMATATRQDLVQPYLSSAHAGWEGLIAEAFREPRQFEGWRPVHSHGSLTLFTGGPMYLEWRQVRGHGSWTGVTLHDGDLILRPSNPVPYEVRWRSLSAAPTHTLNFSVPLQALAQTAEQAEVGGYDLTHLSLIERAGFQDPLLLQLVLAVRRELEEGAPGGRLFAQYVGQLLALHLLRHYTTLGDTTLGDHPAAASAVPGLQAAHLPPAPHTLTTQQLQRVIAYIKDQPSQELTLEVLAAQTSYSASHFARLFRQTTGETPHQYVLRQRLEHAQQLLAAADVPLAQVAAECGFADQSTFTRAFTRALGVTPSAYRRECTGQPAR